MSILGEEWWSKRQRADGISVLHVDDSLDLLEVAGPAVESHSDRITVTNETDPEVGLERLGDEQFDCVVSDFQMPRMNGLELFASVREQGITVPFVLYTGKGSEEIASRAISAGVSEYLQKKGSLDHYSVLANRIETVVDRYRVEQRLHRSHQALEAARDGIAVFDSEETFLYVNEAYANVYGYEPDELLGGSWEHLYPESEQDRYVEEVVPDLDSGGGWKGECVCLHRDGSRFRSTHSITGLDGGGHICVIHHGSVSKEQ